MNNIEKIAPSGIFTNYIFKTIPLAFDESMSYYETLCGILSLLKTQEEVINNNADAIIELESFVNNYFDNLDVQNEINNKLDEMALDGTLADIIAQYIQLQGLLCYDNITDMKNATNLVNGSFAQTYGYFSKGDGGNSKYKIRIVTNEDNIDEKLIIALSNPLLVAELIIENNTVNVKQMGAYGDGTHDDTLSIQTAINTAKNINLNNEIYLITSTYTSIYEYQALLIDEKNNFKINGNGGTLKIRSNNNEYYSLLTIMNSNNVIINNIFL